MKVLGIFICLFLSSTSFAGTGHSHGSGHSHSHGHSHGSSGMIEHADAKKSAEGKIRVLMFQEKIDKSWENAEFDKAELIEVKGKKEWKVTFTNEQGVKGKKLYIFLKQDGTFIAANFTGK